MFLAEVDISKTAYFMMTQNFSQVVTKFIPCDDVTRFDGIALRINSTENFKKERSKEWTLLSLEPVLITASEDQTLKMWNLQKVGEG